MKVEQLVPLPEHQTRFAISHLAMVPDQPGCYALTTYSGDVLYVGLATKSVRSRIGAHLEVPEKRKGSSTGVPFWVHYILRLATQVGPIERGWMNEAILRDGQMPPLNRVYSPL